MTKNNRIKITLMVFALALVFGLLATAFGGVNTVQAGTVLPNCQAGQYFNWDAPLGPSCQICPAGYYCEGGTAPIATQEVFHQSIPP